MTLTLLLRCTSLDDTREFYGSVLGFSVAETEDGTLTADMSGAKLIFTPGDLWGSAPQCSGTFYFTVPDVDGYYAAVKEKVEIAWPLEDMDYGSREFGTKDCNGYTLAFQQAK
jgi:catechol 2,3-dioxygenase-like lactoylglutathione lyase family enzyme